MVYFSILSDIRFIARDDDSQYASVGSLYGLQNISLTKDDVPMNGERVIYSATGENIKDINKFIRNHIQRFGNRVHQIIKSLEDCAFARQYIHCENEADQQEKRDMINLYRRAIAKIRDCYNL